MYRIELSKQAAKDAKLLEQANLKARAVKIIKILESNPYQNPPHYEKLKGQLSSFYSRRINTKHRIVYFINEELKLIRIIAMWTHYETI